MADFPTKANGQLTQGESPSMWSMKPKSTVLKAETDGGYEFRRRRTTRAPRNEIETGFISLPHADYLVLKAFWDAHLEDVAFTYRDYLHDIDRQVRFDEWKPDYTGVGQNRMWTVKIKMSEI